MASIWQGIKKHVTRSHMKRPYTPRWTTESTALNVWTLSLPTLKERTVFALPICQTILLLSHVKHPLPLCPPLPVASPSSHLLFTRLLDQSCCPNRSAMPPVPLPKAPPPQTSRSLAILLQALAGCFWIKFQILSPQQFTSEMSPGCKAYRPNTSQSCEKLVQADNTYSLLNQLDESQG